MQRARVVLGAMAPSLRPWRSARPGILPPTRTRPKPSRRRRTRDAETTPATRCSSLAASVAGGLCALRYPLAFNVGTSLVLVPAYMALLLTRRAPKSAVDRIWSQSDPKGAPWRGERWRARDGSRWWLGALVPAVLGAIFLGLLAENAAAFAGVLRACWSGKVSRSASLCLSLSHPSSLSIAPADLRPPRRACADASPPLRPPDPRPPVSPPRFRDDRPGVDADHPGRLCRGAPRPQRRARGRRPRPPLGGPLLRRRTRGTPLPPRHQGPREKKVRDLCHHSRVIVLSMYCNRSPKATGR